MDPLYEGRWWKVFQEGDPSGEKPYTYVRPAQEGERGAFECEYFILVNKEGGRYGAVQTPVPYKNVLALAHDVVGPTSDADERDYVEYYRTARIKRLEQAARGRRN